MQTEVDILRVGDKALDVSLSLRVLVPLPGSLQSQVEFSFVPSSSACCLSARAPLLKLPVQLPDLFCELPGESLSLAQARSFFKKGWSEQGWASCVKRVVVARAKAERALLGALRQYVLSWRAGLAEIAIALPPGSHVLLQVQLEEDHALVAIKTNLWQLMESVELYLNNLFN